MLVLQRKVGESIVIGEGENAVTVLIKSIQGRSVRLGIEAPRSVRVDRKEVADKRQQPVGK